MRLRPYQAQAVQDFSDRPAPQRMFFAWEMGAGKTLAAIECVRTAKWSNNFQGKPFRLLVICPAIVRPMWQRELTKAFGVCVGSIRWSPKARLGKAEALEREVAYDSAIQVTSFELAPYVKDAPWNFIIIDEVHNLRSGTSKQSKTVRRKLDANLEALALGLSGTLIPNEAKQLWNPVDTFWPGMWGEPKASGNGSWAFESEFCNREESSHGVNYYGLREDRRARLETKLAPLCSRVVQSDFAAYLPPLFVEPLFADNVPDPVEVAVKWYIETRESAAHIGIYCHLRDTARRIYEALSRRASTMVHATLITGDTSVARRDMYLAQMRGASESLIVGTTHALNEGVSLSFQKAALVCEWTTSVDQTLQFIGRFARQDSASQAPTYVSYLVGPNDVGRADRIRERIESINSVLKAGEAERRAEQLFRPYEMSEDAFAAEVSRICSGVSKRGMLWDADDSDDEDA